MSDPSAKLYGNPGEPAVVESLERRQLLDGTSSTGASWPDWVSAIVEDLLHPVQSQIQSRDDDDDDDDDDDGDEWWEDRDRKAPKAKDVNVADMSAEAQSITVAVRYEDDRGIDISSIGSGVAIFGPGGVRFDARLTNVELEKLGAEVEATYTISPADGTWDAGENGEWNVVVGEGAARDAAGNASEGSDKKFKVEIAEHAPVEEPPPPPPVTPPPPPPPVSVPVDEGFGGSSPTTSEFIVEGAITLEDGRILLAGRQGSLADGTSQGMIRRLNADGSVDRSFGRGGTLTTVAGRNVAYHAIAPLAGGGFTVAGRQGNDVLVSRFKPTGAIDKTFADDGTQVLDWGGEDTAYAVTADEAGRIVVGGGSNGAFGLSRLTAVGDVDTFFATRGVALFALGGGTGNTVGAIAIQTDGKIVGAGSVDGAVAVFRLTDVGQTDRAFGTGGITLLKSMSSAGPAGAPDHTFGLALQQDRGIVIANRSGGDFAVERLLYSGSRDRTFGTNGRTTIDFGGDDDADSVVAQASGELLIVGTTTAGGGRIAVASLTSGGDLNTGYGQGGKLTLDAGIGGSGRALHAGSLVLRAFAAARGNQVVVGGSDGSSEQPAGSGLRRLNVPGSGLLGRFGSVDGKNKSLRFVDGDGSVVALSLSAGGSGQAFYDGSNVDLVLSGVGDATRLTINVAGGDGAMTLRNVQTDGAIGIIQARASNLTGTFAAGGSIRKLVVGELRGVIAAAGDIGTLIVRGDAEGAKVLAGTSLGSDHQLGGKNGKADAFAAASIGVLNIRGSATTSLFAAGLDRGNGTFLDRDDKILGGADSRIGVIRIGKGIDDDTRFVAGSLGKADLPISVDLEDDERFVVL